MSRLSLRLSLLAAGLLSTGMAQAVTLSFQNGVDGYAGTQDTMVRSNETASGSGQSSSGDSRNLNFGSLDFLSVDGDDGSPGSKPNHVLIRFDDLFGTGLGQIGADDTIESATLTLQVFDVGSGFRVHDVLLNWAENTATWNSVGNGVQADGVDAATAVLASFGANNSSGNVPTGTLTIDVTSSLQAAQSGTLPGNGWVLLPYTSGTNGVDIRSSEYATLAERPRLTVEVTPVPEPAGVAMMLAGLLGLAGIARRRG